VTSTEPTPADVEADRHHQIAEVFALDRLQQARPQRRDQPQQHLVALDALDALLEELRVEADLERLALERRRHRLRGIADVGSLGGDRQLPRRKGKAERSVALRQLADPAGDVEEVASRQANVVLVGLRQELSKVGELAIDQPRREGDRPCLENRLVGEQRDRHLLNTLGGEDAAELAQRPGGDIGVDLAAQLALQLGPFDRQPVGVGGHHRHLRATGGDKDAGQDRAHVVARRCPGDQVDAGAELLGGNLQPRLLARLRQLREVLGGQDPQVEAGAATADLDVVLGLAQLDLHARIGQRARHLGQQPTRQQHRALAGDISRERRLQAHVEVGGGECHAAVGGAEQDARKSLGGGAGRYSPGNDRELGDKFFAFGRELQGIVAFLSWVRAC
jgi:hypothetical protein